MTFQSKRNYLVILLTVFTLISTTLNPSSLMMFKISGTILGFLALLQLCITYKATVEKDAILYEHQIFFITYKHRYIPVESIEKIELHKDLLKIHWNLGKSFYFSIHTYEFIMEIEKLAELHNIPFELVVKKNGTLLKKEPPLIK